MNHPKHKKSKNPTLPDDQQVDERNLVDLEDSVEISIEDRISMYWMENKGFITGCITVLAIIIIAVNGLRMYKEQAEQQLQANYTSALTEGTLAEFAKENPDNALGGLAALTSADEAYKAEEYNTAIELYSIAAKALADTHLSGRASLGKAFSLYYAEDSANHGIAGLQDILDDSSQPESARAEAAYHLAIEADVTGNSAGFEKCVAQINAMPLAGTWKDRLNYYQTQK